MKRNRIIYCSFIIVFSIILSSCGCGPTFLYNWRPKPWTHPYVGDTYTGLDTLINTNGYYISQYVDTLYFEGQSIPNNKQDTIVPILNTRYNSIMFYDNELCVSLSTRIGFPDDKIISILDTLYSNQVFQNKNMNKGYKLYDTSWGTYEIHNDTIKVYLIENLIGCDGTRKNIISKKYLVSDNKQLKLIFIANSNKEYGYEKTLNVSNSIFHPVENKRNRAECPYLAKKWFYRSDKIKIN